MEQTLPANVTNHYRRNRDSYEQIESRLAQTRERFMSADREQQIEMLQKSHSFAVISVQTPVHIHEEGFKRLWEVDDMSKENIVTALKSVNYNRQKSEYIVHSLQHEDLWHEVADMLEAVESTPHINSYSTTWKESVQQRHPSFCPCSGLLKRCVSIPTSFQHLDLMVIRQLLSLTNTSR